MRVIVIEDTVYKCSENIYLKLIKKQEEIESDPEGYKRDVEFHDFIAQFRDKLKIIGQIDFDFRL